MRFKIEGAAPPRAAIYTDGDDTPFAAPLANISRVKFHSDLPYVQVVSEHTGTLTAGVGSPHNIVAHGLGYEPLVLGTMTLTIGGRVETFPVNGMPPPDYIDLSVVANQSHVQLIGSNSSTPAVTYRLWVLNIGVNNGGVIVPPSDFAGVEITATRFRCGQFDSNNRYPYADASGLVTIATGPTLATAIGFEDEENIVSLRYRYSAGVVVTSPGRWLPVSGYPPLDTAFSGSTMKANS